VDLLVVVVVVPETVTCESSNIRELLLVFAARAGGTS
jgi:hypothetical protein